MIYQSFKISILDNRTKAFGSEAIIKEIKKALHVRNKKDGFVVMIFIKNITFIEEQYDVDTRNDVLNLLEYNGYYDIGKLLQTRERRRVIG